MRRLTFLFLAFLFFIPVISLAKETPKIAVWDLAAGDIKAVYAQDLTSILVSEVNKLGKYEVYSQENVRTLAGWTAERMTLGCTDTKCLTALGQMDIARLISGRVGKIGNRYSVSLNLFDTQQAKAENAVSEIGGSEDELIELVQKAVRKLLGETIPPSGIEGEVREKANPAIVAEKNKLMGAKFLARNKSQGGVQTLPSGLQFKIITPGQGKKPQLDDTVTVHYRGTLVDGTEFYSSYRRGQPLIVPVRGVIRGWTEALLLMQEGAKWQLFIPPNLAYGEHGAGQIIGPHATLIFEVELISIQTKKW